MPNIEFEFDGLFDDDTDDEQLKADDVIPVKAKPKSNPISYGFINRNVNREPYNYYRDYQNPPYQNYAY